MFRLPLWPLESVDSCYLHTLTFADPEPSYQVARKRWHRFLRKYLVPKGYFGVCVPQWGETTGRLHFHLVSSERWDAKYVYDSGVKCGFGRYDVRQRPASVSAYAARYVGRRDGRPSEAKGYRLWSVFGKQHFRTRVSKAIHCGVETKSSTRCAEVGRTALFGFLRWQIKGDANSATTLKIRPDAQPGDPMLMKEITVGHRDLIVAEMLKGRFVSVGEYRSCVCTAKMQVDYQDKSRKVRRVYAEHRVEFGGIQLLIEERLPDDANEKAFVAPAACGDTVGFVQTDKRTYGAKTSYTGEFILAPVPARKS
ncbi:hypothetical protein CCP3SC15_1820007 [Gammaproteobacteria bacterium]